MTVKRLALKVKKTAMTIPILTFLMIAAILLNIGVFRSIILFVYLSFVPGFVLLKIFKLREIGYLSTVLLSLGLSIFVSMLLGFLVNGLYYILGLSQPLSTIPLTAAVSAFTLIVFFLGYKGDLSANFVSSRGTNGKTKSILTISIVLAILPILGIVGAIYVNISIMLLLCAIIAVLCILSIASNKLVPSNFFPLLIFSISLALLLLTVLLSKRTIGDDANLEYYVFRLTQINGHWGPLNDAVNSSLARSYNSMLSISLLPEVYSVLMNLQGEIVFKILYPFIFSLVPVILYGIYEKQTGKLIGFLSTLFFVFTLNAFFGELTGVNRQIVGEFFLMLSIFVWLHGSIPNQKKRLLVIIFGAALAVSHYSIAYIFLAVISIIFIISKIKPKFDETFNFATVLSLLVITFLWYTFISGQLVSHLIYTIQLTFAELITGIIRAQSGTAASMASLPQVITAATWVNLTMSSIANFFIVIGLFVIIVRTKRTGVSLKYKALSIMAGIILAVALFAPSIAATLNFTRFYAITLLFLSPCFVIGGKFLFENIASALMKIGQLYRKKSYSRSTSTKVVLLLIAVLLTTYFLSQSGFINYVSEGAIHSATFDFYRMKTSNDPQIKIQFYAVYIPEQDVFSAVWLSRYANASSFVYADYTSGPRVLTSYALIPNNRVVPLSDTAIPMQSGFIYLSRLNVMDGIISNGPGVFFNSSEILYSLESSNQLYSNGNSDIWHVTIPG